LTREPDVVLPTAPTDKEKYGFIQTYRPLFCAAGIFAFLCTSAGLWLFTLSAPQFYWFGIIATLLQVHVCLYHLMGLFSTNFDFEGHKSILERQPIREDNAPTVDILLPCCKEPLIILENTYKHIKQLEYPASRIKVYVLDDGGIGSVKDLAFQYGFNYLCRDNRPYLKKAGNLRWAFTRTQGEFFVIYDAVSRLLHFNDFSDCSHIE
jgi:cellulose synthase/poly-beta-1,6-N-acetylglucosamine synthase-like glycosyltransferase